MDADLNSILQRHLPKHIHWTRHEPMQSVGAGAPDLNGCANGIEFWIELKRARGLRCKVLPLQVGWMERRARAGGRAFIAIRSERTDDFWLCYGHRAARLLADGVRMVDLPPTCIAYFICGASPAAWDWRTIYKVLTAPAR